MNETLAQYRDKVVQYWQNIDRKQKAVIIGGFVFIFLTMSVLIYQFSKIEYSIAFTDLEPADAAAIKEHLQSSGIKYKLSNDGRTIGVPTAVVSEVKIDVESKGLVRNGSIGYGIFRENISSFGMSQNEFDVLELDAKAGEVQQLISQMNGILKAKVMINVPKRSVFIVQDDSELSTASVVITTKPGYILTQEQIDTIYNLVAHSIAKLSPDSITISDHNLNELLPSSRINGGLDNSSSVIAQQFKIKKQFETDIQMNVQRLLGTLLRPDKVIVSVVSTLNFDKKNTEEQLFTPVNTVDQKGIERSVQEIQKSYTAEGAAEAGGVPGTGTTDVANYPADDGIGNVSSEEVQRTINYEVNQITRKVISSPYLVKDLTINVGIEPPDPNDPDSLSQDTIDAVKRILMNIVGASLADSEQVLTDDELARRVMVISRGFAGQSDSAPSSPLSNSIWYGIGAVVLALALAGGFFVFRRRRSDVAEEDLTEMAQPAFSSFDFDNVPENQVRTQLEMLAKRKPDEFVNLLRSWLADE